MLCNLNVGIRKQRKTAIFSVALIVNGHVCVHEERDDVDFFLLIRLYDD